MIMKKLDTVLLFGNFDLLHPGHRSLLRQAKKYGRRLIVVVTRDAVARIIRGHKLAQSERTRLAAVKALPYIHKAHLGDKTPNHNFHLVRLLKPDVLCLGYDQRWKIPTLKKRLKEFNLHIKIIRLKPFKPSQYKSSLIRNAKSKNQKSKLQHI